MVGMTRDVRPRPAALALGVALLGACGFQVAGVGPGSDAPVIDGPPGVLVDAPPIDGPGPTPDAAPISCWPRWLAGTPTLSGTRALTAVNSSSYDRDPSLSPDGLTLYLSSDRTGSQNGDVWSASRASLTAAFGAATLDTSVSSGSAETRISFTADGLTAALGSSRTGTEGGIDIFLATRASTGVPFGVFTNALLTSVNSSDQEHDPFLSSDGLRLYFAPSTGGQHIEVATRATVASAFGSPTTLIDGDQTDADPTLSPDERVIVFASRRTGSDGADLWFATRATPSDAFGTAVKLASAVNSSDDDADPALSADGCTLYFGSNRAGGLGDFDLHVADVAP